jgi:hypothetical protein
MRLGIPFKRLLLLLAAMLIAATLAGYYLNGEALRQAERYIVIGAAAAFIALFWFRRR